MMSVMATYARTDARHVIYVTRRYFQDPHGDRMAVLIYDERWEAQAAMRLLLADDELLWEDDDWVRSSSGLVLRIRRTRDTSATLRELWEYERATREMALDLSPNLRREARIVRAGELPKERPQVERKKRSGTRGPTKAAPPGYVHVSDVALSLGVPARDARRALRKIMKKPDVGWRFPPSELEDLKKKIAEVLA